MNITRRGWVLAPAYWAERQIPERGFEFRQQRN
jgi:hypothetical protein